MLGAPLAGTELLDCSAEGAICTTGAALALSPMVDVANTSDADWGVAVGVGVLNVPVAANVPVA